MARKLDLSNVVGTFDETFERCNKANDGKGVTILQIAEEIWGGFPATDVLGAYIDLINEVPYMEFYIPKIGTCPHFDKEMVMLLSIFHANGHKVAPIVKMLPEDPTTKQLKTKEV